MIYQRMIAEHKRLEDKIHSIQSQLSKCPDGKLFCTRNGPHFKWYCSDGKSAVYIPKSNRSFAEQLAVKKYLSTLLDELLQEKRAIDFYLRHHSPSPGKSIQMLTEMPAYQDLLAPYFRPLSQELFQWMQEPYESNPVMPERLIHKTSSGNFVRSKSEAMIAQSLYIHQIPFRYECALSLGETTIFPDFTIRHPHTGETYYWEHHGLMDDPKYRKNAFSKQQLYADYGILPTMKLITTYETRTQPLAFEKVEQLVQEYFL